MFNIDIQFIPTVKVMQGRYEAFGIYVNNLKKPLTQSVEKVLVPAITKNFDVQGRPKWDALAPSTVEKKGFSTILYETGQLRSVATAKSIWKVKTSAGVGTASVDSLPGAEYGMYHQSGFINARTGTAVSARPFMVIQDEEERAVEEVFDEWLEDRIRQVFG